MHESSDCCEIGFVDQTQGLQCVCTTGFCAQWEEAVVIEIHNPMGSWDMLDSHIEDTDQQIERSHKIWKGREQLRLGSNKQQPGSIERAGLVCSPLSTDGQVKITTEEILQEWIVT